MQQFDVVAIGNAIVDVLAKVDDGFLQKHGMQKGGMILIDEQQAEEIYKDMPPSTEKSGGSAANTVAGLVSLGGRAAFIGKVRNDQLGDIFTHDLRSLGVHYTTEPSGRGANTARCLVAVTPDAERSMATFLGATRGITTGDIDAGLIKNSRILYLEGYLWDEPNAKEAMREAVRVAIQCGCVISLSLSDPFCVTRHKAELLELITANVDILFANEQEVLELLDAGSLKEATPQLSSMCRIAAVTRGGQGSLVISGEEIHEIEPVKGLNVIDTTGAGDLYASGFLFGYTHGHSLGECGRIATIAASEIIQHIGARPEIVLAGLLENSIVSVIDNK